MIAKKRLKLPSIVTLTGLVLMAIAIPIVAKLAQTSQDTRNRAAYDTPTPTGTCAKNGETLYMGHPCCSGLSPTNCIGSGSYATCICTSPSIITPTPTVGAVCCQNNTTHFYQLAYICQSGTTQVALNFCRIPTSTPAPTAAPTIPAYVPTGALCGGLFVIGNTCSKCQYGYNTQWGQKFCNNVPYLSITQNGNQYVFTLLSYPDGELGNNIKTVIANTGKNSFTITVNPASDAYLSKMLTDINKKLPATILNNHGKTPPTKQELSTIIDAVYKTVNEYKITYYLQNVTVASLTKYISFSSPLLGDRMKNGFYTCWEAALLAKEELSQLGITSVDFTHLSIHVGLVYYGSSGSHAIEPLLDQVY